MSKLAYHFGHALLDGPLKDRGVREPDTVIISRTLLYRLEIDVRVLTLISSFLDCSGFLEEAGRVPEASEFTRQLVAALSRLETSQGKAIGHMLSGAIKMDANLMLIHRDSVLSSACLPDLVAKEAYHLPLALQAC